MVRIHDEATHHPLPPLRPYQCQAGRAVLRSVEECLGRTITIEIARQGGKNELSSRIEVSLLLDHLAEPADLIKCAPTFRPQLRISMRRLWAAIAKAKLTGGAWREGNAIGIGRARALFLSAEPHANVVGHTASLLLEVDEAQDVEPEKFDRDFRPMASAQNATTVLYGTPWSDTTLLERAKQANLEAERRDGERRHFAYDWQHVARWNPAYATYVENERRRLGETHPLFLTQYCLKLIAGGGRLFSASQRAQIEGAHERMTRPRAGESYVAGLDLAGGDDGDVAQAPGLWDGDVAQAPGLWVSSMPHSSGARRDSTVLTIGRLVYPEAGAIVREPRVEIVEHLAWTGTPHEALLPRLLDLLRDVWRVARVAVDATGLGETASRLLAASLGSGVVEPVKFTAESKSQLGFELLAAVNGGRLKAYRGDGSAEHREFWRQAERARAAYRANRTMNFFVDPAEGHDDYLVSAALLVHASRGRTPRVATGRVREAAAV